MAVEVRIPTVFRKFTDGQSLVELDAGTVGRVIEELESRYPELKGQIRTGEGQLHRFVNIYVNDEDSRYLEKLETKVSEGDTVSLLPSVAGGDDSPR
ncbi:MAG: MoaD family protein [Actinobacteria bacterium]|nr:MoaD family protein [Actinomycetota bacterium]